MTKRCNILGVALFCCVLMLVPRLASGQPFTVTSDDPGINVVPTFTYVSGDTWDLHVLVEHAVSTATVDIIVSKTQGGQRPSLRDLTFDLVATSTAYLSVSLNVLGELGEVNLDSLDSLYFDPPYDPYETTPDRELIIAQLEVYDDVVFIECHGVGRARIGGDLIGGLWLFERNGFYNKPRIDDLVIAGDLFDDVWLVTQHAEVNKFTVGGNVGTALNPVTVFASVYGRIGTFECNNFFGEFRAEQGLRRFVANGSFVGDFYAANINVTDLGEGDLGAVINDFDGTFSTYGTLAGDIVIGGDLASASYIFLRSVLPSTSTVSIGGALDGQLFMNEDEGIEGQILINAAGASDPNHELWGGTVHVWDEATQEFFQLSPDETGDNEAPYYGVLSADFGGGAIGLVPFMYHAKDSTPDHDTVITTGAFTGTVTVEHYGPVADVDDDTSTTPPVTVYQLALMVPPPGTVPDPRTTEVCDNRWTDVTGNYTYGVSGRNVTVSGTFANWRAYQIIPNDLVCNIDGTPDVVYAQGWQGTIGCTGLDQTYGCGFQVKTGFDLNQNQVVESGDVETWLIEPADFDGDDNAHVIDLSLLVDAAVNGDDE
ncbi:MAG: hypothetical protein KJZ65_12560 [Phycisphaerales bacterium]|nr:hypothetical protein [Phycisphaerales bacterium]